MKGIIIILLCFATLELVAILTLPHKKEANHDYYLDVSKTGYILYDTKDNRKVASWKWNESPKLDSIIDKDNQ